MSVDACRSAFPSGNCGVVNCSESRHNHYQVILVDPPWQYPVGGKNYQGSMPYKPMKFGELKALPIHDIAEKDCALLLWSTGPFLDKAVKLINAWGFKYITMFAVWRKIYKSGRPVCCPGHYTRSCHEFLLLGTRGTVGRFRRTASLSQLIDTDYKSLADTEHTIVAQRTSHSTKPNEAYALIEEFYNCDRKIELFARAKQSGFDAWGLELDGYFIKDDENPTRMEHRCSCRHAVKRKRRQTQALLVN